MVHGGFVCLLVGISDADVQCFVYLGNLALCRFHSIRLALRKRFIHLQHNLRMFLTISVLSQKSKPWRRASLACVIARRLTLDWTFARFDAKYLFRTDQLLCKEYQVET